MIIQVPTLSLKVFNINNFKKFIIYIIFRLCEIFETELNNYVKDQEDPCRIDPSSVLSKMYLNILRNDYFMDLVNILLLLNTIELINIQNILNSYLSV